MTKTNTNYRTETRVIGLNGVRIRINDQVEYFSNSELYKFLNQSVEVRYNPDNPTKVIVILPDLSVVQVRRLTKKNSVLEETGLEEMQIEAEIARQLDALGGELQVAARRLRNAPYAAVEQVIFESQIKLGHIESAAVLVRLGCLHQANAMLALRDIPQVELLDEEVDQIESTERLASIR